ncbi:hypothetical protein PPERSA_05416 [Pseudocohnilembus persalinus]|uniref:Protein arginine N-methyltransferase n=1 Tax=Pseudocohnilembus persalinus TaxID=266149 RepID=A0A0V0R7X1_PSEPJ|nr:hypothetical protein PPERSA_05416 [Pseudocohnilembus persalinus]|eukprot:KRX10596.1 hypothetical protein PPERSA_05416 [Pseudocohnilembus persalinus]
MGYEIPTSGYTLYTGKEIPNDTKKINLKSEFDKAKSFRFDFVVTSIFPKDIKREKNKFQLHDSTHIKSDMILNNWKQVALRCSNLDLDCEDEEEAKLNKFLLKQEIGYAAYLGCYAIILPFPKSSNCPNFIRTISKLHKNQFFGSCQIWLSIPLVANKEHDTWDLFQSIKQSLNFGSQKVLGVALQVRQNLPPQNILARWQAENLRLIEIPTKIFTQNSKNMPILSKDHEAFILDVFKYQPNFLIQTQQDNQIPDLEYKNYLCYVFGKQPKMNEEQMLTVDFYDVLQDPLQPYKHNLESGTYQVFEADEPKYNLYEEAVYKALMTKNMEDTTVIFLVGAGRAPILRRALKAADRANRKIYIYAVEKNPYAVQTIKYLNEKYASEWKGRVELVAKDMKLWQPEKKADILLSELLGSFGDNELSPECLEWAQQYLKEDGISIPYNYTSFLTPVACQQISDCCPKRDITYLVYMNTKYYTSKIQSVFTFTHPNQNQKFKQFKSLKFNFTENNYLHGLAGFFESVLHSDVLMSINPDTHTPDMLSWFPIFIPFDKPFFVYKSDTLVINIWRKANKTSIWYEWQYELYGENDQKFPRLRSRIQNLEGKGCQIFL